MRNSHEKMASVVDFIINEKGAQPSATKILRNFHEKSLSPPFVFVASGDEANLVGENVEYFRPSYF